jgi:hypothetical protein
MSFASSVWIGKECSFHGPMFFPPHKALNSKRYVRLFLLPFYKKIEELLEYFMQTNATAHTAKILLVH